MNITKSAGSVAGNALLVVQSVAASSVVKSSVVDVSSRFGAAIFIDFGRRIATAAGAGVKFRIEASSRASGDGYWNPFPTLETDFIAAEAEALTGTNAAGQPTVAMASTANLAAGQSVFLDNTGNILNSEWHRIKSLVPNTSVTFEDNLLFAQNAGAATLYNKAEIFPPIQLDLTPYLRLRVVVDGSLFTQAFAVRAELSGGDSIS